MRLSENGHTRERGGGIEGFEDRQAKDKPLLWIPPPFLLIEQRSHLVMMKST